MSRLVIVIRAGGAGTRLWPLSTTERPKQFVPVLGELTLLQQTFERVRDFGIDSIFVTTNVRHVDLVREQLPELAPSNIIAEPAKRNTGPAIAYETAVLAQRFAGEDVVIASLTSDDFVGNPESFRDALGHIADFLETHPDEIVMPMITPRVADVGFSYLRAQFIESDRIARITEWVEKPDVTTCSAMVESGEWFAHAGMYFWKLTTAVRAFETHAPEVWARVCTVRDAENLTDALALAEQLPSISIESLITKNYAHKSAYLADEWQWSDVGKWHVVKTLLPEGAERNVQTPGRVHFIDTKNTLVYSTTGRRVVCVGVEDLVVVDTGDELLVCRAEDSARIGSLIEKI